MTFLFYYNALISSVLLFILILNFHKTFFTNTYLLINFNITFTVASVYFIFLFPDVFSEIFSMFAFANQFLVLEKLKHAGNLFW